MVGVSVYLSVLLPASTCSAGDTESQPQSISSATARYFEHTREDRDSLRGGRSAKLASRRKNITNACCMAYDILTVVSSFRTYHRPRPPILPIRASFSASGDQKTTARPGYEADEAGTSTTSESSWYVPAAFCYQRPCRRLLAVTAHLYVVAMDLSDLVRARWRKAAQAGLALSAPTRREAAKRPAEP